MPSPPNTPPKFIHVKAVAISPKQAGRSERLRSGELHIGPHRHRLICDNGTLRQEFPNAAELTTNTRITLHYKTSLLPLQKKVQIDTANLFADFSASQFQDFELPVLRDGIRVVFTCQTAPTAPTAHVIPQNPVSVPATTPSTDGTLTPTTDAILEDCPQFRILVIGESGVGKSSLIHSAFGIDNAYSSDFVRGEADIEKGLESEVNKRFILHDSLGFEAADSVNYDIVKRFIRNRRACAPKSKLHAVWFCVAVPRAGGRLLEAAAEDFFNTKKETMGTDIPIIVVYTKIDLFVNDRAIKLTSSGPQRGQESLADLAFSEAMSDIEKTHQEIDRFAGERIPYAVVSTKKYMHTLQRLVELTSNQIEAHNAPGTQIPPEAIVLIAAQRIDPNLKIKGTIDVGRQKYWKALGSSAAFEGHLLMACLSVIHTDIVTVWNFNDPACHLSEKEFKDLLVKMTQRIEIPSVSNPARKILAVSGSSLVAVVSAILASAANPAAPIVLPVIAGLTLAAWLYGVYWSAKSVQQLFIAYIVDLTHVLETLAIFTAHNHKKLTRRAIKLAYQTYCSSDLMTQAHSNIQEYRELDGRDAALEMIEDLIKPDRYGDAGLRNYYADVDMLDLTEFKLDQEEEW